MSKLTRSNSHDNISLNPVSKIIHSKPTAHGAGEASLGAKDDATAMSSSNKHIVSSPNGIAASVLTDTIRGFRPELHCKATLSNAEHMMAVAQTKELSLPVDFLPGEDDVKVREDVTCEGPKRKTVCHGELIATKYRLLFVTKPPEPVQVLVNIPIGMISQIEKVGGQKFSQISDTAAYGIAVDCKDLRRYFFGSAREQHQRRNLFNLLTALVFPFSLNKPDPEDSLQFFSSFFAWNYKKKVFPDKIDDGWTIYNKVTDYTRMGIRRTGADHWLINTEINQNYELCDTYPNVLVVPANFDSLRIFSVAAFRSRNRLPVLSWYCKKTSATITRASQPLTGLNRKSQDDVEYLNEIANTNFNGHSALFIMDARPKVNAIANKGNGGGYEDYSNCELEFQNIQNIHVMRESLSKLYSAIRHGSQEDKTWFNDSANSNWLLHIRAIMASVQRIVTLIDIDQRSVLVHCSDGWDRTAQLTSLSMLTLDPYYRTLIGFITLIEKEWISFGHKFLLRIGHGDKIYSERSPVFLQFLDCTYQLLQEFGSAFEFNEKLLLTIADALHSCQYGTFLLNSDKSRTTMRASEQTMSLWTDVQRDYKNYLNPSYNAQALHVLPIHSTTIQIDLWNNYYCQHQAEHQSATDQASGHRFPTLFHIRHKLAADSTFPRNDDDDSSQTKSRTSSYAHTGTHDFDSQTAF